jgi:hypothetical protein
MQSIVYQDNRNVKRHAHGLLAQLQKITDDIEMLKCTHEHLSMVGNKIVCKDCNTEAFTL